MNKGYFYIDLNLRMVKYNFHEISLEAFYFYFPVDCMNSIRSFWYDFILNLGRMDGKGISYINNSLYIANISYDKILSIFINVPELTMSNI